MAGGGHFTPRFAQGLERTSGTPPENRRNRRLGGRAVAEEACIHASLTSADRHLLVHHRLSVQKEHAGDCGFLRPF